MSHFRGLRRDSDSLRQVALHQHQDLLRSDLVQRSTSFLLHSLHGSLSTQSKAQVVTRDTGRSSAEERPLSGLAGGLPNPTPKRLPRRYLRRGPPPTVARPAAPDARLTFHREPRREHRFRVRPSADDDWLLAEAEPFFSQ